ncbi:hypothetical protein [Vulgatibacter incomptus]|uniref:Uncharacterized protein n=1 Tax=Vulgatibacter incomptus TaxID=1391653 RepID=A0A0K1P901_9BACT|nr:hypothetical protein [Vulgatibacter incomptus]AKU90008.1 hypothetical protein AKJ08_0395 [Vulgatibacter incomptus]
MTLRRILPVLAVLSCVTSERIPPPKAPELIGSRPAIGRKIELELTANGGPLVLGAAVGKVTLLCVLGRSGDSTADACRTAQLRWGDRITVVGLATSEEVSIADIPFRTYADPDGVALKDRFELGPESKVILTDTRGRVAKVIEPDDLGAVEEALRSLIE